MITEPISKSPRSRRVTTGKRAKGPVKAKRAGESKFTPLEALESLLRSRVVADYIERLIEDALAPRVARLTAAQRKAIRAYLYDQLTSDPFLRGLISRLGGALKARSRPSHAPSLSASANRADFPRPSVPLLGISRSRSSG
jgi:hypothetical protein